MTLTEFIEEKEQGEELDKLRKFLLDNLERSRSKMSQSYGDWDLAQEAYRTVTHEDEEDRKAADKKQPRKLVVPVTRAQVQTFVTFVLMQWTQNEHYFDLEPTGNEDYRLRDVSLKLLDREVKSVGLFNKWLSFLLDIGRFNLGVMKTYWDEEVVEYEEEEVNFSSETTDADLLVAGADDSSLTSEVTVFEGSRVENISPYNFFYDTRLPLSRWQEGQFAADECSYHIKELKRWEREGLVGGVDHVEPMTDTVHEKRKSTRLTGFGAEFDKRKKNDDKDFMVCVTTFEARLRLSDYDLGNGGFMDDKEQIYVIQIANDTRILSIQPLNVRYTGFTYAVSSMEPDQLAELSDSLATLIEPMQTVVSWLFNSRIASVRTNLGGRTIIDGRYIEMADFQSGSPYIRAKKAAPPMGLEKFVHQLRTVDTTQNHFADADSVSKMIQAVTGVNENAMGQYHSGRRSAAESRAVNSGASARMKTISTSIWGQSIDHQGRQLLKNLRQNISLEKFTQILGSDMAPLHEEFKPRNSYTLLGSEDFFVVDATTPIEKGYVAQSLQELLIAVISNPMIMQIMPLDISAMMQEIQSLRGVKNLGRFLIKTPEQQAQLQNGLQQIQRVGPAGDAAPTSAV